MKGRGFVVLGALLAALAIAGDAYAAHALPARVSDALVERFARGMNYLLLHGIALAALGSRISSLAERLALGGIALGAIVFGFALALSVIWPVLPWTRFAPYGGGLLILSWLFMGLAALLRTER
jgi:uncharacterized membrane protein YgdD (TMEM256/DUF423 family)